MALERALNGSTTTTSTPAVYTMSEACAKLRISINLGYQLAATNEFPVPIIRVGRRVVVSAAALDRLLSGEQSVS